jgi:hypothetical protein
MTGSRAAISTAIGTPPPTAVEIQSAPSSSVTSYTRGTCIRFATSSDSNHNVCCLGKDDGVSILILCQCFPCLIGQLSSSLLAQCSDGIRNRGRGKMA